MKNEFDELLLKKFDEHEFEYQPASWEKLSQSLRPSPSTGRTRKFVWMRNAGIAASLLLALSTLAWFLHHDAPDQTNGTPHEIVSANKPALPSTTEPIQQEPSHTNMNAQTPPVYTTRSQRRSPASPSPAMASVQQKQPAPAVNNAAKATQQPAETIVAPEQQVNIALEDKTNIPIAAHNPSYPKDPVFMQDPVPAPRKNNANISITGGLNYGSLNTGYMAGISAKQKLGNKLFLEGDLTLLNNQSDQVAAVTPSQYDAFNSGNGSQRPVTNTVQQGATNFLYLQFNPSVGYSIQKNLSLSIGADLQKWLNNNNSDVKTLVFNSSDAPKLIPGLDVGITGKTEYAVTKRLKAGLLYREGLNNLIHGSGEYLDRRYIQVQLKFRVLGK